MVDRGWVILNKEIRAMHEKCPSFVNSLYGRQPENDVTDDWVAANYVANLIFQAEEDFLTSVEVDQSDSAAWINIFMNFSCSRPLYTYWKKSRNYYAITSQKLVDLVFEYALKLKNNDVKTIASATKILMETPEYIDIIKTRLSVERG